MLRLIYVVIFNLFRTPYLMMKVRRMAANKDEFSEEMRYLAGKKLVKYLRESGHITTEVYGTENLPKEGGYMMFPNHQGKYDVLAILYAHEKPCSFVMDKKKSYTIMVRELVNLLDAKRMEIDNVRQALRIINELTKEVKNGKKYIIFSEGGYTNNHNNLQEFKPGSFKSATRAKVPIVPVCLIDTYIPFNTMSLKPCKNKVIFLEPIMPEDYADLKTPEIAELVKQRIIDKMEEFGIKQEPYKFMDQIKENAAKTSENIKKSIDQNKKNK